MFVISRGSVLKKGILVGLVREFFSRKMKKKVKFNKCKGVKIIKK